MLLGEYSWVIWKIVAKYTWHNTYHVNHFKCTISGIMYSYIVVHQSLLLILLSKYPEMELLHPLLILCSCLHFEDTGLGEWEQEWTNQSQNSRAAVGLSWGEQTWTHSEPSQHVALFYSSHMQLRSGRSSGWSAGCSHDFGWAGQHVKAVKKCPGLEDMHILLGDYSYWLWDIIWVMSSNKFYLLFFPILAWKSFVRFISRFFI